MNISFVYTLLKAAKITAILSFLGGTFLLILFFYHEGAYVIFEYGINFAWIALVLNSILFFTLCLAFLRSDLERKKIFKTLIIMLINVPISFEYLCMTSTYNVP